MGKVTKSMLREELRPFYDIGRLGSAMATKIWGIHIFNVLHFFLRAKGIKNAESRQFYINRRSNSDRSLRVRAFRPKNRKEKLPALLYAHGGGYMMGIPEQAIPFYQELLNQKDLAVFAPDYRKSINHPYPAGFDDCYDTLLWMKENADELNIHADKFIIAGHSAGGGIAAAISMKARDTGDINIAFQMPIYPMIDHRQNTKSAQIIGSPVCDAINNRFGWYHYLKDLNSSDVPVYASPSLCRDYGSLPPTISMVGDLDPFHDETKHFIDALREAKVPVKFKVFKRAFHAFDIVAPNSQISKEAIKYQNSSFSEFFERYI